MSWLGSAAIAICFVCVVLTIAYSFAPEGWRTYTSSFLAAALIGLDLVLDQLIGVPWDTVFDQKTATLVALMVSLMSAFSKYITNHFTPKKKKK